MADPELHDRMRVISDVLEEFGLADAAESVRAAVECGDELVAYRLALPMLIDLCGQLGLDIVAPLTWVPVISCDLESLLVSCYPCSRRPPTRLHSMAGMRPIVVPPSAVVVRLDRFFYPASRGNPWTIYLGRCRHCGSLSWGALPTFPPLGER